MSNATCILLWFVFGYVASGAFYRFVVHEMPTADDRWLLRRWSAVIMLFGPFALFGVILTYNCMEHGVEWYWWKKP